MPGEVSFVIKDPVNDRFFRFREPEVFLAQQMDGSTTLDAIRKRGEQRFSAALPPAMLGRFVEKLGTLGLLDVDGGEAVSDSDKRWRIRGSILYLRFKAFNPDALFTRLVGRVRFFFTPWFGVCAAALIVCALVVSILNRAEIGATFVRFTRPDVLLAAWLVLITVLTLHEFAHGLSCKHFGGRVREMGFMLIFFQPAMYCNVSHAWLFPEKSKRLWVTFAGAYFELFLSAVATITWRITDPNLLVNHLSFVIMVTSGVKTFFNLNPLIKLDGYYLLSDLLEIPNLNRRAMGFLGRKFACLFGMQGPTDADDVSPYEAKVFWIYGSLALVFSFWLLGWVALYFGGRLVASYQATGFALAAGLWLIMFRHPLTRTLSGTRRWLVSGAGAARLRRLVKILVTLAMLSCILLLGTMELNVSATFSIAPVQNADIRPEVEGIIERVFVDEGDIVEAGAPIAQLSDVGYRSELEKVRAQIAGTTAKLRLLETGPIREEIELAESEVETARAKEAQASERYEEAQRVRAETLAKAETTVEKARQQLTMALRETERVGALYERGAGTPKELADAQSVSQVRRKELEEAQADLRVLLANDLAELRDRMLVSQREVRQAENRLAILMAGSRPEKIDGTKAEIAELTAQARFLEQQLQLLRVASPISGIITTPKLKEKEGQLVERGDLIACVHRLDTVTAEIAVPEKEIADVHRGQDVVIKARAFPGKSFHGRVASIAPMAGADEDTVAGTTILVRAEFDNSDGWLKPEMTGHAKIRCGKRCILDIATRRIVRYFRVEFWSWW